MFVLDLAMAIGPLIGYIAQLKLIKKTKQIGSFSIDVCAILLIANVLRLYFWFTTGYAFALFVQSLLMIVMQLMLLQQCVRLKQTQKISYFQIQSFWRWETFQQYIKFILVFIASITIITVICQVLTLGFYGQIIGYASTSIQAALGLPQLISNYNTKSVKGLSFTMIGTWFVGDFFKTLYFVLESQPFPFILCGAIQLSVDIFIILQIITYSNDQSNVKVSDNQYDIEQNGDQITSAQ